MKVYYSKQRVAATALLVAMLALGCAEDPQALVASAKAFLAKNDTSAAIIQLRNALQAEPKLAEARFLLGKTLLDTDDVLAAEKELRQALQLGYPLEQVAPPLSRAMAILGRHKELVAEFGQVQIASPEVRVEVLTYVGEAQLALGNTEAARNAFTLALAYRPDFLPAHLGQARILVHAGKLDEAARVIDAALAISKTNPDLWHFKGDLLVALRRFDSALDAYRKAIEVKPNFIPGHRALAALLIQQGKLDDAARQVEAMKRVAPRHPQTYHLQALLGYHRSDFTAARAAIQQQLRVMPDDVPALSLAAAIEYKLKAYAQAEAHALKVLRRSSGQAFARRLLIVVYMRTGQPGKALDTLNPVLDQIEDDAGMLTLAGEVFMANDDSARAAKYFSAAAKLDPKDVRKRTAAAMSQYFAAGAADRAIRELSAASGIDSGIGSDLAILAVHLERREYDKALAAIAKIETKQPGTPLPHNLRGRVLASKRDLDGARRSFERALEVDPAHVPAAANLAKLDLADKKPDVARRRLEAVLEKSPKNFDALLALAGVREQAAAIARAEAGTVARTPAKADEAVVALIDKAIAAHPGEPRPRIALIRYYMRTNEPQKAIAASQQALAALPERTDVMATAADAYRVAGDMVQSVDIHKRMAALKPGNPQLQLRLADAQLAAKNREGAMHSLRKALALKPDLIEAQRGIIKLSLEAGELREAVGVAREVQKQRPTDEIGYVLEGDIHAGRRDWGQAATVYRNGLAQVKSSNLALRLHSVLDASGGGAAQRFASSWLKDHPRDDQFRQYVAEHTATKKDYATAVEHFRKLVEHHPQNPHILNNLAWVESQLKDPRALEHAERANALMPNYPAFMDTLGVLLVEKGDTARGLELLRKASAGDPNAPDIRLNVAKALIKVGQKDAARRELDELAKLGNKFPGQAEVAQLKSRL